MKTKSPKTTTTKHRPSVAEMHAQAWELGNLATRLRIRSDMLRERAQRQQLKEMASRALRLVSVVPGEEMPPHDPSALARHLAKRAGVPVVKLKAAE